MSFHEADEGQGIVRRSGRLTPHQDLSHITDSDTVITTIISKNYMAAARTLMRSIRRFHEDVHLVVGLVDEIGDKFNPDTEDFFTILAADLGIPRWSHFALKYDIMELNTAIKPYLLEVLADTFQAQRVIYFDPDIMVFHPLDELFSLLDEHTYVLTPHLLDPIEDGRHPGEREIMQAGAYNLGFFSCSRSRGWRAMLQWWQARLYSGCFSDVSQGLFTDQKWIDLVPSLFEGAYILRNPGYNVAYWNFKTRTLALEDDGAYTVDGHPLIFFHFSGYSVKKPEVVSKHQNRFTFQDLNDAYAHIFNHYREQMIESGFFEVNAWPYAYGVFEDGVKISAWLRRCLREYDLEGDIWPDAFDIQDPSNFRDWASRPTTDREFLSPLALTVYQVMPYIRRAFPDIANNPAKKREFGYWFVGQSVEGNIDPYIVEPVKQRLIQIQPVVRQGQHTGQVMNARLRQFYARVVGKLRSIAAQISLQNRYVLRVRNLTAQFRAKVAYFMKHPRQLPGSVMKRLGLAQAVNTSEQPSPNGLPVPDVATRVQQPIIEDPRDPAPLIPDSLPDYEGQPGYGLNLIGYIRTESGVGEVARKILHALKQVDFPVTANSVDEHATGRGADTSVDGYEQGLRHQVNLFCVNADMTYPTMDLLGAKAYLGQHNIGYWFWETSRFPEMWRSAFDVYDEIWVASRFVQEAVSKNAPIPVRHVPIALELEVSETATRESLGLPTDAFVVLNIFDADSIIERKNPFGLIEAFRMAFSEAERANDVRLVMKVTNLNNHPEEKARLLEALDELNGILIMQYLDRPDLNALIKHCDTYISLHRSEGYGLTLKEAMYLGKPVIATAYSGNMDFTNQANSYLVPYTLEYLPRPYPPYTTEDHWALPEVEVAAKHLRDIYEHPEAAQAVGQAAARFIQEHYSYSTIGGQIAQRLDRILEKRGVHHNDKEPVQ